MVNSPSGIYLHFSPQFLKFETCCFNSIVTIPCSLELSCLTQKTFVLRNLYFFVFFCSLELIDLVMADTQLWIGFLIGIRLASPCLPPRPDLIYTSRLPICSFVICYLRICYLLFAHLLFLDWNFSGFPPRPPDLIHASRLHTWYLSFF